MKFKYKKIGVGIARPIIPIEIKYKTKSVKYEVLVDSGADLNIFDAQIGYPLGIDITTGTKDKVGGITGVEEEFYKHRVRISVAGIEYATEAGFKPSMPPMSYGVVGQKGFFDKFVVKFDYSKGRLDINPK